MEFMKEIDSGDGLLQAHDIETGGDELLHDHPATS